MEHKHPDTSAKACVFCKIIRGELPAHIVHADSHTVSFLDNRPLFPGHCLVVPRNHHVTLTDLPPDLLAPLFGHARKLAGVMESAIGAEGSFVAINNKISQTVHHLHVHVVPRRKGDGMKGFFWPRQGYADEAEIERVRGALAGRMAEPA